MNDDARALLRCQAYSAYLTTRVEALTKMVDEGLPLLRADRLAEILREALREAKAAAEREGSAG